MSQIEGLLPREALLWAREQAALQAEKLAHYGASAGEWRAGLYDSLPDITMRVEAYLAGAARTPSPSGAREILAALEKIERMAMGMAGRYHDDLRCIGIATTARTAIESALRAQQRGGGMSGSLVIIESPYAGDVEANVSYARAAMRDSLRRGEYPIASHLLYTQLGILDDAVSAERQLGISAGLAWRRAADRAIFYTDRGWSAGMEQARRLYADEGFPFKERSLATISEGTCLKEKNSD